MLLTPPILLFRNNYPAIVELFHVSISDSYSIRIECNRLDLFIIMF